MKCLACNKSLSDYESTRKYKGTNVYIDLCSACFSLSDMTSFPVDDVPGLNTAYSADYDSLLGENDG